LARDCYPSFKRVRDGPSEFITLLGGATASWCAPQVRARRHRLEAEGFAVSAGPLAELGQDEEPGLRDWGKDRWR
jgi:hypothetical protein